MPEMIAHTRYDNAGKLVSTEPLEEHLHSVGCMAENFAAQFGLGQIGRILGILHDMGKATVIFRKRAGILPHECGHIHYNHPMPGAVYILNILGNTPLGRMLANIIAAHHIGLMDWSHTGTECIERTYYATEHTFANTKMAYDVEYEKNDDYRIDDTIHEILGRISEGCLHINTDTFGINGNGVQYFCGYWGMLYRLLFSVLVDADRLCTEAWYMTGMKANRTHRFATLAELKTRLHKYISTHCTDDTGINKWRNNIRNAALNSVSLNRGVFAIEVDVGGGKTLTDLTFAINHAVNHGMNRIIYAAPVRSIIEQTAKTFKAIFGNESICVHYGDMNTDNTTESALLARDNWDAPIIVTTVEQLFDSMYSNKPTVCRKLHNMVNSVIIIDEFHDLPIDKMWQVTHAINALVHSKLFNSSVVLSSATLPVMDTLNRNLPCNMTSPMLAKPIKKLIGDDLFYAPKMRVQYSYDVSLGDWDTLADRVSAIPTCMVILNTRENAYDFSKYLELKGIECEHLSAALHPIDRENVLNRVLTKLKQKQPVKLICTPIVQTGVDISFPIVYREMCGWTSLMQSGGRCNRHGEMPIGLCIMFPKIGTSLPGLPEIQSEVMQSLMRKVNYDPAAVKKEEYWKTYVSVYSKDTKDGKTKFDGNDIEQYEEREDNIPFSIIESAAHLIGEEQIGIIVSDKSFEDIISKLSLNDVSCLAGMRHLLLSRPDANILARHSVNLIATKKNRAFIKWLIDNGYAFIAGHLSNKYILHTGYDAKYGISQLLRQFSNEYNNR